MALMIRSLAPDLIIYGMLTLGILLAFHNEVQGWAKEWALGCVNSHSCRYSFQLPLPVVFVLICVRGANDHTEQQGENHLGGPDRN